MTITPEFGPYPYMVYMPGKTDAICNQWDVNVYMNFHLKEDLTNY